MQIISFSLFWMNCSSAKVINIINKFCFTRGMSSNGDIYLEKESKFAIEDLFENSLGKNQKSRVGSIRYRNIIRGITPL